MSNKIIYDLGCSTNKTLPEAIGVDVREGVTDYSADIHELEFFGDATADIIISRHSFEHLLDPAKALKEWLRILKPGGKLIFVLPDHEFINTIDPYYSAGQHLHAYTRESFCNFLSLFPELHVTKCETVLENWSFGVVVRKLPRIAILIPHIEYKREEGLVECLKSTVTAYPKDLLGLYIIDGDSMTVPEKIKKGLSWATIDDKYDFVCYAANDMVFHKDCLFHAVVDSLTFDKGLVSFNEGVLLADQGNICTHFIIRKDLISKLENGEIFSTDFHHVGVDNWLWAQCKKMGEAHYCENARIVHNHFSKGVTGIDETYQKGWSHVDEDRKVLAEKLLTLNS